MNEDEREAYVSAALLVQGYDFPPQRIEAIRRQFEQIETIAATIVDAELTSDLESMSIFRP